MIVSGFGQTRSVSGKGTFVIPGLQRVDTLALGAVQVQLSTENEIPTQDAILIHACAVANFQIGQTPELIEIASKNYLNMDKAEMTRQVTEVMLGKMREVIGQMDLKMSSFIRDFNVPFSLLPVSLKSSDSSFLV